MSKTFTLTDSAAAAIVAAKKAGAAIAGADAKRATLFAPLVDTLSQLSGSQEKTAVTQWGAISGTFKEAYAAKVPDAADPAKVAANAWSRSVNEAGLKKPQTPEQARAAEKKRAQTAANNVNPKGKPATEADTKTAAKVAGAVDIEANIAHIAGLIRKGDFLGAQTMLATLAQTANASNVIKAKAPSAPDAPAVKATKTAKVKATAPETAPF